MYYWGKFRNIDTSVDPLGQEYKVVIFTNFDGQHTPYLTNFDGEPDQGRELVMAAQPFMVNYINGDNIYKAYKCSTATVRFMMSNFDSNLFAHSNNKIMVALLKRNNNIQLQGNNKYVNVTTGQVVVRKRSIGLWYGFVPSELDSKIYDVEWIGYATPNTYNQTYTLVEEEFELECQDTLSTLKYEALPLNDFVEIRDIKSLLNSIIGGTGSYKHIYYTTGLYLPDTISSSFYSKVIQQYRNFIDKDDEPVDVLSLLESIGNYLNITFIPFGDSVYVVNYECIASNVGNYYKYTFSNNSNGLFFNYKSDNPTYGDYQIVNLENTLTLNKDVFAADDTNITMQSVYDNFSVYCDEQLVDINPDLSQEKWFDNITVNNTTNTLLLYNFMTTTTAPGRHQTNIVWSGGVIGNYQMNDEIGYESYIYFANYLNEDNIINSHYTPQYPTLTPNIFNYQNSGVQYCGCVNLKNTVIRSAYIQNTSSGYDKDTDWKESYNYDNVFAFWNKSDFDNYTSYINISDTTYNSYFNNNHQIMLKYKSPAVMVNIGKKFQIKGDWKFFHSKFAKTFDGDGTLDLDVNHLYITAQVIFHAYNGDRDYYFATVAESSGGTDLDTKFYAQYINNYNPDNSVNYRVKLPLNDLSIQKNNPLGNNYPFKDIAGQGSQIVIDLDDINDYVGTDYILDVTVNIMNPFITWHGYRVDDLSVSDHYITFASNSAILRNLEFNFIDEEKIEQWGYGDVKTDFRVNINKNLEEITVQNQLSSNQYTSSATYNYCNKKYDNHFFTLDNLNNVATGIVGRPELLKLCDLYNQYHTPTMGINTTVWNHYITPTTKVNYLNKNFIIDRMSFDYEMDRTTLDIVEKKVSDNIPDYVYKMYLENENGRTLNINPFYNEQNGGMVSVDIYSLNNNGNIVGETNWEVIVDATIFFYPSFGDGIFGMVSVPTGLQEQIYINNEGELIIDN